jgi:hypothetical protein
MNVPHDCTVFESMSKKSNPTSNLNMNDKELELKKLELNVLLEEYKATQAIINNRTTIEHNIHYWGILFVTAVIAFLSKSSMSNFKEGNDLFLLVNLPLSILSLMLIRNDIVLCDNARYCDQFLRPRINVILEKCDLKSREILNREEYIYRDTRGGYFNIALGFSRYYTTLISTPLLLILFGHFKTFGQNTIYISYLESFLISVIIFLFCSSNYFILTRIPPALNRVIREGKRSNLLLFKKAYESDELEKTRKLKYQDLLIVCIFTSFIFENLYFYWFFRNDLFSFYKKIWHFIVAIIKFFLP